MRKLLIGISVLVGCSTSTSPLAGGPDAGTDGAPPVEDAGTDGSGTAPDAASAIAGDGGLLSLGGSFDALAIAVVDGTAFSLDGGASPMVASELRAFFSNRSTLCQSGVLRDGETVFTIAAQSGKKPFSTGIYEATQQYGPGNVDVSITKLNGACGSSQDFGAASGTVEITSVTDAMVSGTVDVTLRNDAGTLQGFFNVPICNRALSPSCQP